MGSGKDAGSSRRAGESRYQTLFTSMPVAVGVYEAVEDGTDFAILDLNPAAEKMGGVRLAEVVGRRLTEVFPRVVGIGLLDVFRRVWRTGVPERQEAELPGDTGLQSWRENFVYKLPSGEMVAVYQDTTGRKVSEEALLRSQTELKAIYDNAPIMMCVLDPDRQVLYANRAFADFVGRPLEELRLERACGVIGCLRALDDPRGCGHGPKCETCNVRLAMVDALATGRAHHGMEYRTTALCRGQPRDSVFLASVAAIEISGRTSLLLCLEDVTVREGAAEALRESEEQYRALVHASLDAVLLTSPDGAIHAANPGACRMFRCSEAELIRKGRAGVVDAADPRLAAALEERDRTGTFHGVLTHVRADGSRFPGEVSTAVFRVRNDQVRNSLVIRDVSERLIVEHELQRSQVQLRALAARIEEIREQERSEVARELHDELGQSLTALKMDLRWLVKRLDPGMAEMKVKIDGLVGLADQTIQMVQRIASRLRPGLLDDLGLAAAIEWLGADCGRHTGVRCDVSVDVPERRIGPRSTTTIFRIVQEALTNVVRHAAASRVTVRLRETDGRLEAVVSDDGSGISDVQAADAHSLGLLGMRERAQAIGGNIAIRGYPGKGTTVILTIPLAPEGRGNNAETGNPS